MRVLYGVPASPFVRKVRVVLAEKQLPYTNVPVLHHKFPASFERVDRTISPLGKIPAYQDDQVTLADSSVICAYLERTTPEPPLYPTDPCAYARALWLEEYGDTELASVLTAKLFVLRFIVPRFLQQPPDEAAIGRIVDEDLPPLFDYLESQIAPHGALDGTAFSIGDIGVATQFVNLYYYAGIDVDATRWPRLAGYLERVLARSSFQQVIEEERPLFPSP